MLNKIKDLINKNDILEYKNLVPVLFEDEQLIKICTKLMEHTDFCYAPASSSFHDSEEFGLINHSLRVAYWGFKLKESFDIDVSNDSILFMSLFHDLCKIHQYEKYYRNVKNEETNKWEKKLAYKIKEDYTANGHGIESVFRLLKLGIDFNKWEKELEAIKWHLGAFDFSPYELKSYNNCCRNNSLILFLHTIDMLSTTRDIK